MDMKKRETKYLNTMAEENDFQLEELQHPPSLRQHTMDSIDDFDESAANKDSPAPTPKGLTLEDVMEEIKGLKLIVYEVANKQNTVEKGITDQVVGLRGSLFAIQATVEALEVIAVSQGKDDSTNFEKQPTNDPDLLTEQERFDKELADMDWSSKSGNDEDYFGGGRFGCSSSVFAGVESMDDRSVDLSVMQRNVSKSVERPFVPDYWLKEDTPAKSYNSEKQTLLVSRSDFKRHTRNSKTPPTFSGDGVNKKLFKETPSPNPTMRGSLKTSTKLSQSEKKVTVKLEEATPKRARKSDGETSKGKETADPTSLEMKRLVVRDAQVCTYLFHHASDSNLRNERLVWTMGLTATRAELKCLTPGESINEVAIALAAARITRNQVDRQSVWTLPPSFALDLEDRVSVTQIREKYKDWMTPFPNLKFIYIPLRVAPDFQWYLMVVDVEAMITYRLDSNCPLISSSTRQMKVKQIGVLLYHIVRAGGHSNVFRNKSIGFQYNKIVEATLGMPNPPSWDNSGVWVIHWMNMEHLFHPNCLIHPLNEKAVRMKIAADLLIGDHNILRLEVLEKTDAYLKTIDSPANKPIHIDDD